MSNLWFRWLLIILFGCWYSIWLYTWSRYAALLSAAIATSSSIMFCSNIWDCLYGWASCCAGAGCSLLSSIGLYLWSLHMALFQVFFYVLKASLYVSTLQSWLNFGNAANIWAFVIEVTRSWSATTFNGILRATGILDGLSGSTEYIDFFIDNIVGLPYSSALAMLTTIPESKNGPYFFRRW